MPKETESNSAKKEAQEAVNPPENWSDVELKEDSVRPKGPAQN